MTLGRLIDELKALESAMGRYIEVVVVDNHDDKGIAIEDVVMNNRTIKIIKEHE